MWIKQKNYQDHLIEHSENPTVDEDELCNLKKKKCFHCQTLIWKKNFDRHTKRCSKKNKISFKEEDEVTNAIMELFTKQNPDLFKDVAVVNLNPKDTAIATISPKKPDPNLMKVCSFCDTWVSKSNMAKHVKKYHPEKEIKKGKPLKTDNPKCLYCNKTPKDSFKHKAYCKYDPANMNDEIMQNHPKADLLDFNGFEDIVWCSKRTLPALQRVIDNLNLFDKIMRNGRINYTQNMHYEFNQTEWNTELCEKYEHKQINEKYNIYLKEKKLHITTFWNINPSWISPDKTPEFMEMKTPWLKNPVTTIKYRFKNSKIKGKKKSKFDNPKTSKNMLYYLSGGNVDDKMPDSMKQMVMKRLAKERDKYQQKLEPEPQFSDDEEIEQEEEIIDIE